MLAPGKRYINAPLTLTVNFKDDAGDDYDPTTVTLKTISPCGVQATYVYGTDDEVTKDSVGDYSGDITPNEAGRWWFRWESTGSVVATEGDFLIQNSRFYPNTLLWWDYGP